MLWHAVGLARGDLVGGVPCTKAFLLLRENWRRSKEADSRFQEHGPNQGSPGGMVLLSLGA